MNYLARHNPWTAVWWSVALPGLGQIYLGLHVRGIILMAWEILVNHEARLNLAIYHSLLGDIATARSVICYEWAVIYPLFYIFSMYDAYQSCMELNRLCDLERLQQRRTFDRVAISPVGIGVLTRRNPIMTALWSAGLPGLGQVSNDRTIKALILMGWYLAIVLLSGMARASYHTLLGELQQASLDLDYQWLLFWPSIYLYGIVDAYTDTLNQNNICDDSFRWRLRKYLRNSRK